MRKVFLVFAVLLAIALLTPTNLYAQEDATLYMPNGVSISIPLESWQVEVVPKGFNSFPYNADTNAKGKLPGWGGWPSYTDGCKSGLVLGAEVCKRSPYFITFPEQKPEPEACTPSGELTLGGNPC